MYSLQRDAETARLKLKDLHVALSLIQKGTSTLDTNKLPFFQKTVHSLLSSAWKEGDENSSIPAIQLPLETLRCTKNDSNMLLEYLEAEEIKGRLGAQRCTFFVHHSHQGLLFETAHSDYCDLDNDISYDVNAFQKMKEENREAWEYKWGGIEYDRTMQKLIQAMLAVDLSLHVERAEKMSSLAASAAMSWSMTDFAEKYAMFTVERVIGDSLSYDVIMRASKIPVVDIHVCNRTWSDGSYGLGFIFSTTLTLDLYEKSIEEEGVDTQKCILTVRCSVRQGVPIDCGFDINNDVRFRDCCDTDHFSSTGSAYFLLDGNDGNVHMSIFKPGLRGPFPSCNDSSPTRSLVTNKRRSICDAITKMEDPPKIAKALDGILYAWGDNRNGLLGFASNGKAATDSFCANPAPMLFRPVSAREIIQSIECSDCHILALTNIGTVYSCGDGSFGQLGHGNLNLYRQLHLVTTFIDSKGNRIVITQVSAGSHSVGVHSAAVDSDGYLYTWGKSIICGHVSEMNERRKPQPYTTTPRKVKVMETYKTIKVSCGGGFTVALAKTRQTNTTIDEITPKEHRVFSWGIISQGRLGLGQPKREVESDLFGRKSLKRTQQCEIRPRIIQSLTQITDVSAGANHCLAVTSQGKLIAWGSNNYGQCGVTDLDQSTLQTMHRRGNQDRYDGMKEKKSTSLWDDIWLPREIPVVGAVDDIFFMSVSSGGIHSAAIDKNGVLYTWGGGGESNCLGHGDQVQYEYGNDNRIDSRRRQVLAMSGRLEVPLWSSPRAVESLIEENISLVSLGERNGAAVTETGNMYVWGYDSIALQKSGAPDEQHSNSSSTSLPMKPNLSILPSLEGKRILNASCGMSTTFCVAADDCKANDLGTKLYHECQTALSIPKHDGKSGEPLWDCILLAGGRPLYCHKVIISQRSRILDHMLTLESRPQDPSHFTEVVIPGVQFNMMQNVLYFIYRDMVPNFEWFTFETVLELWEAANLLKIFKLMAICKNVLETDHMYFVKMDNTTESMLPCFGSDMSNALDDSSYCDVQISVEGKTLRAHKCVLRCTSTYFASLIEASEGNMSKNGSSIAIVLPGTYTSAARVLHFLYNGYLQSCTQNDLLEDLITAHRYALNYVYRGAIDSAIEVTPSNACAMLLLAVKVQSPRLKIHALNTIANNLHKQVEDEVHVAGAEFESMLSQCPSYIKNELFEKIKNVNGVKCLISKDRKDLAATRLERSRLHKSNMQSKMVNDITGDKDSLSMKNLLVLLLIMVAYGYLQRFSSIKAFIPILNGSVLIMIFIHLYQKIQ